MRIEPTGQVTHTWLGEPITIEIDDQVAIVVPSDGPPRLELTLPGAANPLVWRTRDQAHAAWLGQQLVALQQAQTDRASDAAEVPAALRGLTRTPERS